MGSPNRRGLSVYRQIRNESLVNNNSPHQLILLVYDALIEKLVRLEVALSELEVKPDGGKIFADQLLNIMQLIQYGLRDSLDFKSGEQVSLSLDKTYVSWIMTLEFLATSRRPDRLKKLIEAVRQLHDAWKVAFASLSAAE